MVALRSGVAPQHWLADTRALVTATDVLEEADRKRR